MNDTEHNLDRSIPKLGETLTWVSINKVLIKKKDQRFGGARGQNTNGSIMHSHLQS